MAEGAVDLIRIFTTLAPYVILGAVLIPSWLATHEPSENWFRVASLTIADTKEGEPITMNVSRVINRPFVGNWVATVRRVDEAGFVVMCNANGSSSYRVDAVYPKPLTLDWWTHPMKCALPKGKYRLDTVWQFDVPFMVYTVTKTVTAESNVFEVN